MLWQGEDRCGKSQQTEDTMPSNSQPGQNKSKFGNGMQMVTLEEGADGEVQCQGLTGDTQKRLVEKGMGRSIGERIREEGGSLSIP